MLKHLMRAYLLDRMMRGGSRRRHSYGYGYGRRRRHRGGMFPLPHYSTRTRRGTRVSVGGCCLPIPLGLLVAGGALTRLALRR